MFYAGISHSIVAAVFVLLYPLTKLKVSVDCISECKSVDTKKLYIMNIQTFKRESSVYYKLRIYYTFFLMKEL